MVTPHETLINGKWKLVVQKCNAPGHYSGWLVDLRKNRQFVWSIEGEGPPSFMLQPKMDGYYIPNTVKEYIEALGK